MPLLLLAQTTDTGFSTWADLAKAGGPICIFILLVVACVIALSKWVWIPLRAQSNEADDRRQKNTIEIASKFQAASEKLDSSVARLDEMHERCHNRMSPSAARDAA